MWNIAVNDVGAAYDPLTLLRSRTMFGRPDWKSIYTNLRMAIEGGRYLPGREASLKTGVRVSPVLSLYHPQCGCSCIVKIDLFLWSTSLVALFVLCLFDALFQQPNALAKAVREEADRASTEHIEFTFAKEHF